MCHLLHKSIYTAYAFANTVGVIELVGVDKFYLYS